MRKRRNFFSSRKNWQCMVATLLLSIPIVFRFAELDKAGKQYLLTTYIVAVASVWGINVGGTSLEDYGRKMGKCGRCGKDIDPKP